MFIAVVLVRHETTIVFATLELSFVVRGWKIELTENSEFCHFRTKKSRSGPWDK